MMVRGNLLKVPVNSDSTMHTELNGYQGFYQTKRVKNQSEIHDNS